MNCFVVLVMFQHTHSLSSFHHQQQQQIKESSLLFLCVLAKLSPTKDIQLLEQQASNSNKYDELLQLTAPCLLQQIDDVLL